MKNTRNAVHVAEVLKDRRAYRDTLIQRREDIEKKIQTTENQIKVLRQPEDK